MEDAAAPPDMKLNGAPPGVAGAIPPTDVAPDVEVAVKALARELALCGKAGVETMTVVLAG
jgi:hypothetical protein